MKNQHQNANIHANQVIQHHTNKTNIMVIPPIQSMALHKFKLKFKRMVQLKVPSQSMLTFQHTKLVSTNTHLVIILVVMVCIRDWSLKIFLNYKSVLAIKILGWGVDSATQTPYWLVANCEFDEFFFRLISWNFLFVFFLAWNEDWGDKGFFKILRGSDECGIESGIVAGLPKL